MKPITLVVEDSYNLRSGDYLIITSEDSFIHVANSERVSEDDLEEVAPGEHKKRKPKRTYKKRRKVAKKFARPNKQEMQVRYDKVLNAIIKYPGRQASYYMNRVHLNKTQWSSVFRRLRSHNLVKFEQDGVGKLRRRSAINPA